MKVWRFLGLILLGGLVGGVISIVFNIANGFHFVTLKLENNQVMMTITFITLLIILLLFIYSLWIQRKALVCKQYIYQNKVDSDTDLLEKEGEQLFWQVGMLMYGQYTVLFIYCFILVLGNASDRFLWYIPFVVFVTSLSVLPYNFFVRKYDQRFPKVGEKQYTEKVLAIMDEGERHITLLSMYKTYSINISLLIIGIIVLGCYSISSQSNQSVGMFILIVLFIYNAFAYMLKVRNFYKI
ncbi:DUF3169 family protein [Staphylococcus sp. 17KM0847]|uniref:DUF3169 family protein n=1 Tax=Staphylococcus sp. 17KM0847 TaxID=2583989 RepID=UPI0015DC9F14|nr:DUF3169 family protein [Staphylococcus sp. 17KM0847]QLK85266.1 DUF3169 family protein [Staphylococcus sp. 17KM0847]